MFVPQLHVRAPQLLRKRMNLRQTDTPDFKEIIDFAMKVANEHLVPWAIAPRLLGTAHRT
jgi:hypothetical protein